MDEYISFLNPIQVQLHNIYIKSLKDVHKVFWRKQAQIHV